MISNLLIWINNVLRKKVLGKFFMLLYKSKRFTIGENFSCDSFPYVNITQSAKIRIGKNVYFRRDVELRAHGDASIIIHDNVKIDRSCRILATNKSTIIIGEGSKIAFYTVFNGGDSITLGKNTLCSGFVYFQTSMHKYKNSDIVIMDQGYDHGPITVDDNVWIGAHVVILPNVEIGTGSIIGSNAVVNRSCNNKSIIGGIPAKEIKFRDSSN